MTNQPPSPAIVSDGRLTPIRQLARDQITQLVQKYNAIPDGERPCLTKANSE